MGKLLGTKIYMGKMEGVKLVIVKEFNEGELTKHVNNSGKLSSNDSEILKKAESLIFLRALWEGAYDTRHAKQWVSSLSMALK